jgi:UDP-2-acetamido-2,6-beta-L-arabino-hexul-4-ose reductase
MINILVTGSEGFIARNLIARLKEMQDINILYFNKQNSDDDLELSLQKSDFIFHLAGVNRSTNDRDFQETNVVLTGKILLGLKKLDKTSPIVLASSIQALNNSPYGKSKKSAESLLIKQAKEYNLPIAIYRLPNVFGKWSKPNYNSVVATFCYNISRDMPIEISNPVNTIELLYIDDLIDDFVSLIYKFNLAEVYKSVNKTYKITLEKLSSTLRAFHEQRHALFVPETGSDLIKYLYATYLSFLPSNQFSYKLTCKEDSRGTFAEFIKTDKNGQFSFFTINPKYTRGIHYHHTKSEKFLILKGCVLFKAKNLLNQEIWEKEVEDVSCEVIESIPGWVHSLENIGQDVAIVILWSNEIFNNEKPDTYQSL